MAFIDDRPVACLGWGSAAWSVKSRDSFIGLDKSTKEKNLHFVANNTRFLKLLHIRQLIAKIPRSRRWRVTQKGHDILSSIIIAYNEYYQKNLICQQG